MTTRSTSKKTLQNFHARNTLWQAFNSHAEEMECSVDYLINEAMRMYASNQGFLEASSTGSKPQPPRPSGKEPAPTIREKPAGRLPRPTKKSGGSSSGPKPGAPSLPRPGGGGMGQTSAPKPSPAVPAVPRPSSPPPKPPAPAEPSRPTLTLIFQGKKVGITSDQFIIGRGNKSADLPIKDANISRKHAAIIFHNGAYYMKDLGSTNGVDFNGKPVDSKRIDEGDVFSICGFDLHFTYTA